MSKKGPGGGRPGKAKRPTGKDNGLLWVISDRDALTNTYFPAIVSGDRTFSLSREGAVAYAHTVLEAIGRANYDAAVLKQLSQKIGIDLQTAAGFISEVMRPERPEIDFSPTKPLTFRPGINKDLLGFVDIFWDDEHIGQMRAKQAYRHAMWVLEVVSVVDLDAQYLRMLKTMDLGDNALGIVADVANYRAEL